MAIVYKDCGCLTPLQIVNGVGNRSSTKYLEDKIIKVLHRYDFKINYHQIHSIPIIPLVIYEAYLDNEWNRAFLEGNSALLRKMMQWNSRCSLEYSTIQDFNYSNLSLTVLNVAIMKNDIELMKIVFSAFKPHETICWGNSYFPSELSWECMIGGMSSSHIWSLSLDLARKLGRREILEILENPSSNDVHVDEKTSNPLEYEQLTHLNSYTSGCWQEEWNEGFDVDVDYNFEQDHVHRKLLRFHYVWKDPKKFQSMIPTITLSKSAKEAEEVIEGLSMLHDAQGQTPFHTLVEYINFEEFEWIKFYKVLHLICYITNHFFKGMKELFILFFESTLLKFR